MITSVYRSNEDIISFEFAFIFEINYFAINLIWTLYKLERMLMQQVVLKSTLNFIKLKLPKVNDVLSLLVIYFGQKVFIYCSQIMEMLLIFLF